MAMPTLIFLALAALLVGSSLLVVFLRNVVHSALALVAALLIISVFFVILQAPMVGVLQVLVYAGAIMVLFLFVIMFLNLTATEPRRLGWLSLAGALALLLAGLMAAITRPGPSWSRRVRAGPRRSAPAGGRARRVGVGGRVG